MSTVVRTLVLAAIVSVGGQTYAAAVPTSASPVLREFDAAKMADAVDPPAARSNPLTGASDAGDA